MNCFPRQSDCCCCSSCSPCCSYMGDCCSVRRNRSCIDCFPTRLVPDMQIPQKKNKSKPPPIKPTTPKATGKRVPPMKNGKRISFPTASEPSIDPKGKLKCQCDPKQTKNKQNFQYQDLKKRMEVISEEAEHDSDEDEHFGSKKIQNSCADFLSIVHDTVLETVQSSVDCMMRNYFVHTMEKIETLCSQMMRNECLLSKMYLDILDKLSQQNEKSLRQFKCLCQFVAETQKEASEERAQNQRCNCPNCSCTEEDFVSLAREKVLSKSRRLSGNGNGNGNFNFNNGRNGNANVYKSEQNHRHHRDSDAEPKTDPSITSCTKSLPLPLPKTKTRETPLSSINMGNEDIRRNVRRLSEFSDSSALENGNKRRNFELLKTDDAYKADQFVNRMEGGRYINVKTRPSDTFISNVQL